MKSDLKKIQEENKDLNEQLLALRNDQSKNQEIHMQLEIFRQKEEDFERQLAHLQARAEVAEEEVCLLYFLDYLVVIIQNY